MILAGDIGGTKTNLALYTYKDGALEIQVQHQFVSQKYQNFSDVIEEFISSYKIENIEAVCLGIAGPIINGVCKTTNLPWTIDSKELQIVCNTSKVKLLNDLEATAYGMLYLNEDEFVDVNPNGKKVDANRAVIAAGTGLGEAILFYNGENYYPIGSEGGHCDFAAQNSLQDELLVWMRKRHPEHVSVERLVSGIGIYTIYEFLKEKNFAKESKIMLELNESDDKNAMVTKCALEGDTLCTKAIKIFVEIYGAEAGNLALKSLSLGGVYIGGGIAPKILPFLLDGNFLNAFAAKGRFQETLINMQIKISLNQNTALLGSAHFAVDKVR
ncbi:glucokinase [Arcobacter acticola]|jgi:glucokinase|uniref:Glucokinase n=1 Tax=Arcobacter acticola TaxID=1849015 RepID=A0A6M8EW87_9BACT|nr:glucokinase [Arcobacter acticola]QKE28767.1 glucokinase [Arcobacter acticola]